MKKRIGAFVGASVAAAEIGASVFLFRRTLMRKNAKQERTENMAGTNWETYMPEMICRKEWLSDKPKEDVYIKSEDGLKLHATYFPIEDSKKLVICFHGYTSKGLNDYTSLAKFYLPLGYQMLMVDERSHGESEGKFIGFGNLDRHDARRWIQYMVKRLGEDCEILLHGISMGASTVLMTSGLTLPDNVKGIVSDCAFTSAWDVFAAVLKSSYHMPAFPILQISNLLAKKYAGYGLRECNAAEEVKKATVPILFIHGKEDTFVPVRMVHEIYNNCASPKLLLLIEGAGHAEAYYKNGELYEKKILELMNYREK